MANKPNIRFKGFTDDWEQRKLGEIIDAYNEKKPKNIDLPVLTSSRQGIQKQEEHFGSEQKHDTKDYNVIPMGYCTYRNRSDDKTFTFNINHSVKRGIVSKFYPVFSIINGNAKFITEFLNNNLEIKNKLAVLAVGTSQVVLSFANLKELEICVPSKLEQDKIGNYIETLDHLITLHQRKCDETKKLKKFMLQKMFPKNGEKNPEIRFAGFTDDWEQRKLGEIAERVQGNDGRMNLPILTISAANGWMSQEDRFSGNIAGKEQSNYTLLHKGELSYNHGNSKLAKYGTVFSLEAYKEALVPRVYHSFKTTGGNSNFIEYYFATKLLDKELAKLISSGARMDGLLNIGFKEFMGINLKLPLYSEQVKIAEYLRNLDHLITLHQRKCDKLKLIKKFMLQNMFPKKG